MADEPFLFRIGHIGGRECIPCAGNQYQAGMYGHPDPSFYAASSGQFYPGGGGNQKPGQSTVCTEDYVKVDCNSLQMDFRNGGIDHAVVYQQGLNGYDEDSHKFVTSARAAEGASKNGKRLLTIRKHILPGGEGIPQIIGGELLGEGTAATTTYEEIYSSPTIENVAIVAGDDSFSKVGIKEANVDNIYNRVVAVKVES